MIRGALLYTPMPFALLSARASAAHQRPGAGNPVALEQRASRFLDTLRHTVSLIL